MPTMLVRNRCICGASIGAFVCFIGACEALVIDSCRCFCGAYSALPWRPMIRRCGGACFLGACLRRFCCEALRLVLRTGYRSPFLSVPSWRPMTRCLRGACFIGASVAPVHVRNRCACGAWCLCRAHTSVFLWRLSSALLWRLIHRRLWGACHVTCDSHRRFCGACLWHAHVSSVLLRRLFHRCFCGAHAACMFVIGASVALGACATPVRRCLCGACHRRLCGV